VETHDRTHPRTRPDTPLCTQTFYRRLASRTSSDNTASSPRVPRTRPRTPTHRHFSHSRNRSPTVRSTSSRNRSPISRARVRRLVSLRSNWSVGRSFVIGPRPSRTSPYARRIAESTPPLTFAHLFAVAHALTASRVFASYRPSARAPRFKNFSRTRSLCRQCTSAPIDPGARSRGRWQKSSIDRDGMRSGARRGEV
ncbi:predicted protein, partial [Ostreococcus lucimarinus CCE9901]